MAFAIVVVLAAAALDLALASRDPRARAGGPVAFVAFAATLAAILAALLPIGAILPEPSLSHVAPVPSWDPLHPCLAPPHPASRWHAFAPFALIRVALPLAVVVGLATRPLPRARFLLGASFALAAWVSFLAVPRLFRRGVPLTELTTCGAFTPEQGFDGRAVRALLDHTNRDGRQELVSFRELPRLPPPPWVRGEIAVTIAGDPYSLRMRGQRVVAEPDDPRRAERPLPALHLASIPAIEHGTTPDGRPASVLIDRRADGKWYAVRLGQPLSFAEIAPIVRPPWWPVAVLFGVVSIVVFAIRVCRRAPNDSGPNAPYRTAPDVRTTRFREAVPALCALALVEASFTALHVLGPYLSGP